MRNGDERLADVQLEIDSNGTMHRYTLGVVEPGEEPFCAFGDFVPAVRDADVLERGRITFSLRGDKRSVTLPLR